MNEEDIEKISKKFNIPKEDNLINALNEMLLVLKQGELGGIKPKILSNIHNKDTYEEAFMEVEAYLDLCIHYAEKLNCLIKKEDI